MSVALFLLTLGAAARVTRFLNADVLFEPARAWVERRYGAGSRPAYLLTCPWCASIWVTPPILAAGLALGETLWFAAPAACLTISYLYGLVASHLDQ